MTIQPKVPLDALIVEDRPEDAKLVVRELEDGGFAVTHRRVCTGAEMREALGLKNWDVILCDFALPHFSGTAALQLVQELGCDAPFIYVSGTIGEETAVSAMLSGAQDYVMKDNLARLAPAVKRELRDAAARREAKRADHLMRESEHKYRHLFESLSDAAFLTVEETGKIVDTNAEAEVLLARSRNEILGRHYEECYSLPPENVSFATGIGAHCEGESDVLRKDGVRVPVRVRASRIQLHGCALILALVRDITEQRRAAAALRESEALHRSVVTAMAEGLIVQNADGRIVAVNPAAEKIAGRSAAEIIGRTSGDGIFGAIREDGTPFPGSEHPAAVTLRTGEPQSEVIMGIHRPEGELRWLSINAQPLVARVGERPHAVVTTFHDITAHRKAEGALRASEERLSRVFYLCPTPISIVRAADNRFVEVNEAFVKGTGYIREELLGRTPDELRLWAVPEERVAIIREVQEKGFAITRKVRSRRKSGEIGVGLSSMSIIPLNGEAHLLWLILDISELEHAEEALRDSEQRFRQIAENIDEVFWLTDTAKERMIYVSPAYAGVWGRTCESLYAAPESWMEAVHPADRERVRGALPLQAGGGYDVEYRIVRPDGGVRWIHDRASAIKDGRGAVYRIAGIAADITKRRQLEEQFLQAQKMEAVGQLAGGISHDFNNLLTIIQMQCGFLLGEVGTNASVTAGINQLIEAANRGASLTRQLLAFGRRHVKEDARDINLADLLGSMTKLLRRLLGEDIELEGRFAARLPTVHADPGMMEQVLMNLVINARDAMPNGGRLVVEVAATELDASYVASHASARTGCFVCLSVRDTGSGIAPEVLPRIFEPFFTTKEVGKGTGLGLATVLGILLQHQGWIDVESEVGRGTTFRAFLPATAKSAVADEPATSPKITGGYETILLVEDEAIVRGLAAEALRSFGYTVRQAHYGLEALAEWDKCHGAIDLLVTDLVMPGGMSGQALVAKLRAIRPDLKVIYSTGYSAELHSRKLKVRAGWDYLPKPYSIHDLALIVRRRLDDIDLPKSVSGAQNGGQFRGSQHGQA